MLDCVHDHQTHSMDLVVYIITYNSGTRSTNIQMIDPHSRWDTLQASYSLSLVGNSSLLTQVRHSSWQSSATHSYLCMQYFCVSKQWCGYQCWGFLTCTQMSMHVIAHGSCTNIISSENLHWKVTLGEKSLAGKGCRRIHWATCPPNFNTQLHAVSWQPTPCQWQTSQSIIVTSRDQIK